MRSSIKSESPRRAADGTVSSRLQYWLLLFGFWTVLPFLGAALADLAIGHPVSFPRPPMVLYVLLLWWAWVPLTPLIVTLGRRFPLREAGVPPEGGKWDRAPKGGKWNIVKHALIHMLASWLVAFVLSFYMMAMTALIPVIPGGYAQEWSATLILTNAFKVFEGPGALAQIIYWTVLAVSLTLASYQRSRQRTALLAEARLESLKAQVHPHFLFNTLNTISTLMDEDVQAARRMISHLSELLRASLRSHAAQEVTLGEELELVGLYLEIEKVRFEDRLHLHFEIEDETRDALVPHLMLQPLVENAILHGISRDSTAGELRLEARRLGGLLRLRIHDDGPGPPDVVPPEGGKRNSPGDPSSGEGIGLANARARLDELYGRYGRLELRRRQPRGTTVVVELLFSDN